MIEQELKNLAVTLEEMPEFIIRLVSGLSPEELKQKPSEEEFSIQENIWHLRDIEKEGYSVRIQKLLSEDRPTFQDINGKKLAEERGYNNLDFAEGLAEFAQARKETVARIKELSLEQLNCCGTFDDAGDVTLEQMLLMMREHDADHRRELKDLVNP